MRVALGSVVVDDEYREQIACRWGRHRDKATREEVRSFVREYGESIDADMQAEWEDCEECNPEAAR